MTSEAEAIKERGGFILAVTAPIEVRYLRAIKRGRISENISLIEFIKIEENENSNNDPYDQNVSSVITTADFNISNHCDIQELKFEIDKLIEKLLRDL